MRSRFINGENKFVACVSFITINFNLSTKFTAPKIIAINNVFIILVPYNATNLMIMLIHPFKEQIKQQDQTNNKKVIKHKGHYHGQEKDLLSVSYLMWTVFWKQL